MSNFPITNTPSASPARCALCGYADKERSYVDFAGKLDFEWYGSLQLCEDCVGAVANDFGFLQPDQARNLELRVQEAESELITLRAAVLQLEALGDIVAGLVGNNAVHGSRSDGLAVRSSDTDQRVSAKTTGNEGSADSGSTEQTASKRSDDVSDIIAGADDLLANL